MALFMPTATRFYKICALAGLLIIVLTVTFSWMRMQQFDQSISVVFERIITTNMEVSGLNEELQHIDRVLKVVDETETSSGKEKEEVIVDDISYTPYEIERLRNEKKNILFYLKEKELDMKESSSIKKHVMNEVRLLFGMSLLFLVLGTLLAAFGMLAWYFKIEMFEDRRRMPR